MSTLQSGRIDVNLTKSQKLKKKKSSSDKLDQTLSSRRKVRITLPLRFLKKKKRKKEASLNLVIKKNIPTLVLVKEDREMES
jgi:hypothetical protein